MKRKILSLLLGWITLGLCAQEYQVSTAVQPKNVLLEEFTGIYCGYCIEGHKIASQLKRVLKDQVSVVAVHSGPFAPADSTEVDLTSKDGIELSYLLGSVWGGFPNGAVNRRGWHNLGKFYYSRNFWEEFAYRVVEEKAPVNLWAAAEWDAQTRLMKIRVEGYYTKDWEGDIPCLNVHLAQNNIVNWQSGDGGGYHYLHQHVLRDMITEVKGDTLPQAKKGDYFVKEYEYEVPKAYKWIEVKPADLELVVFVTQGYKDVVNTITIKPAYTGEILPLKAAVRPHPIPIAGGYRYDFVEMEMTNECNSALTAAQFEVVLNDQVQQVEWQGHIPAFQQQMIRIPVNWNTQAVSSNTYEIRLQELNGETTAGDTLRGRFGKPAMMPDQLVLHLNTDEYAEQNTYRLYDMAGTCLKTFGPFENGTCQHYEEELQLEPNTTYCLEVSDQRGNGIHPRGNAVEFHNADGLVLYKQYAVKDFGMRFFFQTQAPTGIDDLMSPTNLQPMEVYNLTGKLVKVTTNLQDLPRGIYLVRKGNVTKKVIR